MGLYGNKLVRVSNQLTSLLREYGELSYFVFTANGADALPLVETRNELMAEITRTLCYMERHNIPRQHVVQFILMKRESQAMTLKELFGCDIECPINSNERNVMELLTLQRSQKVE